MLGALHRQGILPEDIRLGFVRAALAALSDDADASFLDDGPMEAVFTAEEMEEIKEAALTSVFPKITQHVSRLKAKWDPEYPPDEHFSALEKSVERLCAIVTPYELNDTPVMNLHKAVTLAVSEMEELYEEPSATSAPVASSTPHSIGLQGLFRDIDE